MSLTALAFVATYAYGLLRAFTSHPGWGLVTYMAVFYLHPPMRWWGASLPDAIRWALIAAVVTLLALPRAKLPASATPWQSLPITKAIVAYTVWMWIQLAWANPMHFPDLILVTKYCLLLYLFYRIVVNEQWLVAMSMTHVLGCFYFGWLALDASGAGRLEAIGGPGVNDSNTLGMHVSTSLFFAGTLILTQRGWRRWLPLATVPVLANCVVQTESRGAFLGAAVGALAYFYFAPKRHRPVILSLGAISLFVLLAYAPSAYWERIASIGAATSDEEEIDHSAQSRLVIIGAQFRMFKDYPVGLGSRTTAYLSRDYLAAEWLTAASGQDRATHGARASHNSIMSVVTDQGVPGIVISLFALAAIIQMFRRMRQYSRAGHDPTVALMGASCCAALVTVWTAGLFTNYLRAEVQIWCLAMLAAIIQLPQTKPAVASTPARSRYA